MFSTIMVSCDRLETSPDRIGLASNLAKKLDARLIGVGARTFDIPVYTGGEQLMSYADIERFAIAEIDEVRRTFEREAGHNCEFRHSVSDPTRYLNTQSRAADLVLVGRRGDDDSFDSQMGADPGGVILGSGRPVLVVPPKISSLQPKTVAIAWKDTREARRAVRDAIPFLRLADEIQVIEITSGPAAPVAARDVVEWLLGRGIKAEAHAFDGGLSDDGTAFLMNARHMKADLIVSGAYGNSRLREFIFGGFTRGLLQDSNVCCLMSN